MSGAQTITRRHLDRVAIVYVRQLAVMEVREPGREMALWPGTRLTLQRLWLGAGMVGEKYQLLNTGASTLDLAERDLYKRGVMAVSVEQAALRSGETTQLFVILERRADD